MHPSRGFFAVAEKGNQPPINVYTWPGLRLYRILRGGTQKAYAHLNFSPVRSGPAGEQGGGDKLASVGSAPDFMLTVWDWKQESIILRYKAFSQEVYKVTFSPENEGQLTTSGLGHIRYDLILATMLSIAFVLCMHSAHTQNKKIAGRYISLVCEVVK